MNQLNYQLIGMGETITFIHGDTLDQRMWQPQVEYFKDTYQVLTYDMRGYGKSPIPNKTVYHHQDLANLLDYLKISNTHIVGSSYGGEVAIDFTISFPEKVKSLILLDSSLSGFPCDVDWDIHSKDDWLNHQVFASLDKKPQIKQQLKEFVADYSECYWQDINLRGKLSPSANNRLNKIKAPTLVVTGNDDLDYFHRIADRLCQQIPHSIRKHIENAGHMVNLEQPDVVNELISSFIKG